ncbi:proline racemase family protein [Spiroplasma alleghenense]|uniref:Proline racemase n=1 Tax=Spiroplasma alleghenense TaxID=216931 RepID=A0A345Z2P9_9MOLU|nr:proline racemase family protein [Spiroplasma alleghenense]AXK50878.1 proline racemase [Spiroplasma alleghenense]
MKINKGAIMTVESHTAGEPTRIVLSGVPLLKGKNMSEKKEDLLKNYDDFRKLLMHEPRGHNDMFGALLVPPCNPEADFGVIYTESGGCLNMCGHGSIGLATVLVENGMVEVKEPVTEIKLDTPAGLVTAYVDVKNSEVQSVRIKNVPSFLYKENIEVMVPDFGKIKVDISFGGSFFALVDMEQLKTTNEMKNVDFLVDIGMKILNACNEQIKVIHPINEHIKSIDLVEMYEKPNSRHPKNYSNCVVFGMAQFDRSPCGTGTSAKVATLFKRKELKLNEDFVYESIMKTKFIGKVLETTKVKEFDAVIPEIKGNAYITGYANWVLQPTDPFQEGFNPKTHK